MFVESLLFVDLTMMTKESVLLIIKHIKHTLNLHSSHFRMPANTRAGQGNRGDGDLPPLPNPSMAQVLRLLMEDRQAYRET